MEPSHAFRNLSTQRNALFARLKPCCVEISRLSMRQDQDVSTTAGPLISLTDQLYGILSAQANYDDSLLDNKIAEYVFFPLSFIFRKKEDYPSRLIENSTKCLRVLIQHGWKADITRELAQQFLILLTFIVGGVPDQETKPRIPEETLLEGYRALTALIQTAGAVRGPSSPLVEAAVVPALGHGVSVILEGVTDGLTPTIQLEALDAIEALYTSVKDLEALASFLPGTVSSLARVLSPPVSLKTQKRVLVRALQVLKTVLVNAVGDLQTRHIVAKAEKQGAKEAAASDKVLTAAWLKATSSQVKMALSTVLKLRNHDSEDVRAATERFSISLLDECHSSLAESTLILTESAVIASEPDGRASGPEPGLQALDTHASFQGLTRDTTLQDLAIIYPELADTVKSVVYSWATSLPRAMQSGDEDVKQHAIHNLRKGVKLLKDLQIDSSTLEDSLAAALRDSIVTLAVGAGPAKIASEADGDGGESLNYLALARSETPSDYRDNYKPILLAQESQKKTREEMMRLIASIGSPSQQMKLASEMLSFAEDAGGTEQISAYWLSFELVKAAFAQTSDLDDFLDLSSSSDGADLDSIFHDLYSSSVSTLASSPSDSTGTDWRVGAIAMEITAFAASRMRESFRPELIDVLYPVATFLGSPNPQLQSHAITTLNSIAASCGYASVSELIIDNVDYMVNSVSLRLNTFDISPASTKVLTMMIRLAGPRLVPFLDDVVAAIFAALDNYHGYTLFVESLFSVLSEVVQQSVKSDVLLIGSSQPIGTVNHRKSPASVTTIDDILTILDKRVQKRKGKDEEDMSQDKASGHPRRPWKSDEADELLRKHEGGEDEEDGDEGAEEGPSEAEVGKPEAPKTPTYALLSRITTLSQHYLTSPAPTLRKSLLDLLATVSPALAPDATAFLPLVNAVWPVMVARLYDGEPYVVIAACRALGALCASAGDFLSTRIKTEWWDKLGKWCVRIKREAAAASSSSKRTGTKDRSSRQIGSKDQRPGGGDGILIPVRSASGDTISQIVQSPSSPSEARPSGGLGRFAQAAQVWEAVAALLTDVASYVRLDDEVFDQILDLLADTLTDSDHRNRREALESLNADAVWLAMYRRGKVEIGVMRPPVMEGVRFAQLSEL